MTDTPLIKLNAAEAAIARTNGRTVYVWQGQEMSTLDWNVKPAPPVIAPVGFTGKYGALLLNEDFSKLTSFDSSVFAHDWWSSTGTMNNVTTDPNNVSLANGQLVLTLGSSTDGALVSSNPNGGANPGFQFTYGYVEASVTFPSVNGSLVNWPAFWTLGQNWPATEEFDIAEILGGAMTTNYHAPNVTDNSPTIPGDWTGKHVYAMEWRSGVQNVYFDGKLVHSRKCNPVGSPQYIILNQGVDSSRPPVIGAKVLVDYVRVWA